MRDHPQIGHLGSEGSELDTPESEVGDMRGTSDLVCQLADQTHDGTFLCLERPRI